MILGLFARGSIFLALLYYILSEKIYIVIEISSIKNDVLISISAKRDMAIALASLLEERPQFSRYCIAPGITDKNLLRKIKRTSSKIGKLLYMEINRKRLSLPDGYEAVLSNFFANLLYNHFLKRQGKRLSKEVLVCLCTPYNMQTSIENQFFSELVKPYWRQLATALSIEMETHKISKRDWKREAVKLIRAPIGNLAISVLQ